MLAIRLAIQPESGVELGVESKMAIAILSYLQKGVLGKKEMAASLLGEL
jgi:hypothetical protein